MAPLPWLANLLFGVVPMLHAFKNAPLVACVAHDWVGLSEIVHLKISTEFWPLPRQNLGRRFPNQAPFCFSRVYWDILLLLLLLLLLCVYIYIYVQEIYTPLRPLAHHFFTYKFKLLHGHRLADQVLVGFLGSQSLRPPTDLETWTSKVVVKSLENNEFLV